MAMFVSSPRGKPRPTPYVNVTPLVDVALVVLIIFMVVTPMMTKTLWLNLPKKQDKEEQRDDSSDDANAPLVMTVDKAGMIRVNKTVLKPSEVQTRLPRMLAAQRHKVLYFDAHDELPYGRAVHALDLSRAGGAKTVAILTESVVR
jgi:biopolymer transport protein ExbD